MSIHSPTQPSSISLFPHKVRGMMDAAHSDPFLEDSSPLSARTQDSYEVGSTICELGPGRLQNFGWNHFGPCTRCAFMSRCGWDPRKTQKVLTPDLRNAGSVSTNLVVTPPRKSASRLSKIGLQPSWNCPDSRNQDGTSREARGQLRGGPLEDGPQ